MAVSSPSVPLTLDEVEVVLDITERLLTFNGASITVGIKLNTYLHVMFIS